MTLGQVQRMSSAEFTEWVAFYVLEAEEQSGEEAPPSASELGDKLRAWAMQHKAMEQ